MKTNQEIAQQIVQLCQQRKAQELDILIDKFIQNITSEEQFYSEVLNQVANLLKDDCQAAAWSCSYFSGEVSFTPPEIFRLIEELAKVLIDSGLEFLIDFMPYPNCQIVIYNQQKYHQLPQTIKELIASAFDSLEKTRETFIKDSQAICSELN